ncbi:hypothetical protein JQC91_10090 [Jannaschia sp. Os4]|nr:hypothetical protein [Jannaschia sp. Os4]MBM2576653.1 hypothetical protein [Jannaschia sp. Os4]
MPHFEVRPMYHVQNGYRGLSLFLGLNMDRMITVLTILMALLGAAWLQSI